jgi:hypothetical protein
MRVKTRKNTRVATIEMQKYSNKSLFPLINKGPGVMESQGQQVANVTKIKTRIYNSRNFIQGIFNK